MFRIQDVTSAFSKRFLVLRLLSVALLSAILSLGFVSPGFHSTTAEAGSKRSGVKLGGSKRIKTRAIKSGGQRKMRSAGLKMGVSRKMSGGKRVKTYTKRRSVLDAKQVRGGSKRHGVRHGQQMTGGNKKPGHNIRRVKMGGKHGGMHRKGGGHRFDVRDGGKKRKTIRKVDRRKNIAERRSGVTYSGSRKNDSGIRLVAGGNRTIIKKRKLRTASNLAGIRNSGHQKGHKRVYRGTDDYYATGLVVIAGSATQGPAQISGSEDCAYGTYCTIDLGGPKIITFNDVADYSDGDFVEDDFSGDLSEEEYKRKYGTK